MLHIVIQRKEEYAGVIKNSSKKAEDSTIGELRVYDEKGENIFSCFTNGGESTSESGTDRRILAGVYYLRWTSSSTNSGLAKYDYWKKENHLEKIKDGTQGKNIAVWVMSDTIKNHNKRRILILCGYINGNNGKIGNSTKAINDLFLLFEKYGIENFKLTIKEI